MVPLLRTIRVEQWEKSEARPVFPRHEEYSWSFASLGLWLFPGDLRVLSSYTYTSHAFLLQETLPQT